MAKKTKGKGEYASRAGHKLKHAIDKFDLDLKGKIMADLGSSTGGFVDVALKAGAQKVYSVDTAYGQLDWKLRNDERVVVMERQNALFVELPELADIVTIDVGWTPQARIIPKALTLLKSGGTIVSLLKPHYEAKNYRLKLVKGKLAEEDSAKVVDLVKEDLGKMGIEVAGHIESPVKGSKGGNIEYLILIHKYG